MLPGMHDDLVRRLSISLADRFTIERELGGGGMSRVFVALENALGRRVVIKTLPDDAALSATASERFRREILTAAGMEHANIVPVLAAGDAGGTPYFVMPWVDGESLRQRMQRGALPVAEALSILRDVARALAAAHGHGVVHRDIKPENILLAGGAARVTDFGVAKALSAATKGDATREGMTGVGISVGTPAYMAPEQLAADPTLDHRADIYAWALVAYEMLSAHYPFEGLTGASLLEAQLATMPAPLSSRAAGVSEALSALVMGALAKDPGGRPQSSMALVDALDAVPSGRTGPPAPVTSARAAGAALLTTVVVVAAAVGALAWWRGTRGPATTDERVIAVAPFRVSGATTRLHYLREGIADLMVPQLASIEGVKPPSSRQMFDSWRRTAGSIDVDLTDDRARRAAELVGAGQLILGEIVGSEQRLIMNAQLVRVSDGITILRDSVMGVADSLFPMTARLTSKLLALREGVSRERLRGILSAKPEAIMSFLNGEQLYRRGRYADAAVHFAESYRVDTTFALSALRIRTCNGWLPGKPVPGDWLARAYTHRGRLTGNDSIHLAALAGPEYPKPRPEREYYEGLWTAAMRASSPELWYLAADGLYHFGLSAGIPDALSRALDGFRRAEAMDSSYAGALEHQSSLYMFTGDSASARAADRRQASIDSTGDFFILSHTAMRLALGTAAEHAEVTRELLQAPGGPTAFMAANASVGGPYGPNLADLRLAEALFASPSAIRRQLRDTLAATMLRDTYLNTGRIEEMARVFPPDSTPYRLAQDILHTMLWDGDSARAAKAASAVDRWRTRFVDTTGTAASNLPRLARALWAIEHGDMATARVVRAELAHYRPPAARPWLGNTTLLYGKLLDARLAVTAKAANAKALLSELDSMLIDMPRIDARDARVVGNLLIAGMWEEVGERRRALEATRRRDMRFVYPAYASTFLRLNARTADAAGETEEAIRSLRAYVAMRAKAEPALRADVESARQHLARLETGSRGR